MKNVFTHCQVFTGKENDIFLENAAIWIEEDKIVKISQKYNSHPDWQEIDLNGKYVIPGMINPHVHLFGNGKPSKYLIKNKHQKRILKLVSTKLGSKILDIRVTKGITQELISGVTTVRACGDFFNSDIRLRNKINNHLLFGPRLLVSGPAITVKGGHGAGSFAKIAKNDQELTKFVKKNAQAGVDFIKIAITDNIMQTTKKDEIGNIKMNQEQTTMICDLAHSLNLKVAAHAENFAGVEIAIDSGVDTIEKGCSLNKELILKMKKNNQGLTISLSPLLPLAKLDSEITKQSLICSYNAQQQLNEMITGAKNCLNNGVNLGLGTDASFLFVPHSNMWREAICFQKQTNLSNAKVLSLITLGNAQLLGLENEIGTLETGKSADFLVLNKNPLKNLKALKRIEMIVSQGRIIKEPRTKKNKFIEKTLEEMLKKL